jgi:hypothetical protein
LPHFEQKKGGDTFAIYFPTSPALHNFPTPQRKKVPAAYRARLFYYAPKK